MLTNLSTNESALRDPTASPDATKTGTVMEDADLHPPATYMTTLTPIGDKEDHSSR